MGQIQHKKDKLTFAKKLTTTFPFNFWLFLSVFPKSCENHSELPELRNWLKVQPIMSSAEDMDPLPSIENFAFGVFH